MKKSLESTAEGQQTLNRLSQAFSGILGPILATVEKVAVPLFNGLAFVIEKVAAAFSFFAEKMGISQAKIKESTLAIDEVQQEANKKEAERIRAEARSIKPIERYYYTALVRKMNVNGEVKTNVGPRILSVGKVLHQMIIRHIVSEDPQERLGDITHVKTGYDFIIRKEMRADYPNYDRSTFAREPSPLGEADLISSISENLIDLSKFRTLKGLDEIKKELAIHRGLIPDIVQNFDVAQFDSEFQDSKTTKSKSTVSVSASIVEAEADSATDVAIESDEFLADLAEFAQE